MNEMFFIVEGVTQMTKERDERKEEEEYVLSKGDHFGEMSLLTHWKADSNVKCLVFCHFQVFQKKDFQQLKVEYPEMEKRVR